MNTCPSCLSELAEKSRYCIKCGRQFLWGETNREFDTWRSPALTTADEAARKLAVSFLYEPDVELFLKGKDEGFIENFKYFLKDVLCTRATCFDPTLKMVDQTRDPTEWIEDVKRIAVAYLETPWLHNPWLTNYLIREVASCQLQALAYQRNRGIYPEYHLRRSLKEPYNSIAPPLLGAAFFLCLLTLLYYLLSYDQIGWAALVLLYFVYHYSLKVWQMISRGKSRRKLFEYLEMYSIITHDIFSSSYDVDTILRRLKSCEAKGLFPYSVLFALLELKKR
ncbi:MAG: hypothetical protein JNL29_01945 [Nitrospira sp.]|nr:hypothetical protein [Nitrospira sp.]